MRVENAAYRPALIELERQIFSGYLPYEHPTIGSMADLDAAKLEWVTQFHSKYYRPNNAVLTISGGFEPDAAMELAQRYFGPIEPGEPAKFTDPSLPPPRTKEYRSEMADVNAKTKALLIGWRIPPSRTSDHYALEMLARVLADGESSVLYDSLVRTKSLARDVSVYTYDHRGPDAFVMMIELNDGVDEAKVESIIDSTLNAIMTHGPNANVLSRAQQRTKSAFVFGLQSNQARATTLGEYTVFFQNPRLVARDLESLLGIDAGAIRDAARRHLTKASRSLIIVTPKSVPAPLAASVSATPTAGTESTRTKKESH
ncbi:MAG: insulinase family protein [Polyangiaceae bacterium]